MPRFSEELRRLLKVIDDKELSLGALVRETSGREYYLLLLLLALPFITPIPLPGFSIPVGVAAAFFGAQIAIGRTPWLPQRARRLKVRAVDLKMILRGATKILGFLEHIVRPRLSWLVDLSVFQRIGGSFTAICGLWLILPLPLPFSNSLPALTILLLSAAALERDGLCFLAGCGTFALAAGYFVGLVLGGVELMDHWAWWQAR